jgi:hypothetical protein
MFRGMKGLKTEVRLLLNSSMISRLIICATLFCLSFPALALTNPKSNVDAALIQAGAEVAVTVTSTGVNPTSGSEAAGPVTLRVVNQTGEAELSLQLYDGKGVLLRDITITQGQTEWSETFELEAGNYTLIAGRKAEWKYSLTVQ